MFYVGQADDFTYPQMLTYLLLRVFNIRITDKNKL
jgi:hypothetical protein